MASDVGGVSLPVVPSGRLSLLLPLELLTDLTLAVQVSG